VAPLKAAEWVGEGIFSYQEGWHREAPEDEPRPLARGGAFLRGGVRMKALLVLEDGTAF